MPPLSYQMTFADVPFIGDAAQSFRVPGNPVHGQDANSTAPRTQQPLADLIDEVNRLIDMGQLNDFAPPRSPTYRDGALARVRPDLGVPAATVKVGEWYYPTGASRWGVFRSLATSTMVKDMLAATGGSSPGAFVMKAVPASPGPVGDAAFTLSTGLYMLPPRPLGETRGFDGLYLVTLVDGRWYWQGTPVTLTVTSTTTWDDLIGQLSTALDVAIAYSAIDAAYGQPEADSQLWCRNGDAPALLDAVALSVGRVVVREMDGNVTLLTPEESYARVLSNRGEAADAVRLAGGDLFMSGMLLNAGDLRPARNAVVPETVNVTFPQYVVGDDPVPHYVNYRYASPRTTAWFEEGYGGDYTVSVPIASGTCYAGSTLSGLAGVSQQTVHSTAKALYSGEAQLGSAPLNASGLTALAVRVARDLYGQQALAGLDEVYPGTRAWEPEGIHDVLWTWSERKRQASCRVMRVEWNASVCDAQHGTPPSSGYTSVPPGVGGHSVAQTWRDLSGHLVYGANLVTVRGGTVSGGVQNNGVQEVVLTAAGGGSTVILSGDIHSGNLTEVDWQINYHAHFNWRPTYVSGIAGGVYVLAYSDIKLGVTAGAITFNGFVPGLDDDGRLLVVWNRGSSKVTISHDDATANLSGAAVLCPLHHDYDLWPDDGCLLEYDASSQKWRFDHATLGTGNSGGASAPPTVYATREINFNEGSGLGYINHNNGAVDVYSKAGPWQRSGDCAPCLASGAFMWSGINWSGYLVTDVTCDASGLTVTKSIFTFISGWLTKVE